MSLGKLVLGFVSVRACVLMDTCPLGIVVLGLVYFRTRVRIPLKYAKNVENFIVNNNLVVMFLRLRYS